MSWRELAACRGLTAEQFFPDDETNEEATRPARTVCGECPVRVECLDHAVTENLSDGIFGGQPRALREWVRSRYLQGPDTYRLALTTAMADLDAYLGKPGAERAMQARRRCERCAGWVPAGRHPIDRNGPGATCGKTSTYNKGCRCGPCRAAKSRSEKTRNRDRRKR